MKRLYYLADTIDSTEHIARDLHKSGISNWNFHVMSQDEDGLVKHHIHGANTLHRLDVVHSGEQGALIGIVIGLCIGATVMLAKPFNIEMGGLGIAGVVVFFTLFCTWLGGMVGLSHENYKIKRFHDDLSAGKYLIMVDFKKNMEDQVRHMMAKRHPEATFVSEDSTWINPFKMAIEKAAR